MLKNKYTPTHTQKEESPVIFVLAINVTFIFDTKQNQMNPIQEKYRGRLAFPSGSALGIVGDWQ